jgi:hypothetical protein
MRRRKYIIPLAGFVATVIVCAVVIANRSNAVRRMIDEAGREGKPIIAAPALQSGNFFLTSLDDEYVSLPVHDFAADFLHPYFTQSGALRLTSYYPKESPSEQWVIRLPEIYPELVSFGAMLVDTHPYPKLYNYPGISKVLLTSANSDQMGSSDYAIVDLITGERTNYSFAAPPPLPTVETDLPPGYERIHYLLSPDEKVIVLTLRQTTTKADIWRYEIVEGKWIKIIDDGNANGCWGVGPGGKILAVITSQNIGIGIEVAFVDGYSGQSIRVFPYLESCIIGERWVLGRVSGRKDELKVLDMANNWAETTLHFTEETGFDFTFFVPPPSGVEEMERMRKDGSP